MAEGGMRKDAVGLVAVDSSAVYMGHSGKSRSKSKGKSMSKFRACLHPRPSAQSAVKKSRPYRPVSVNDQAFGSLIAPGLSA
jgi:hypothetical protein